MSKDHQSSRPADCENRIRRQFVGHASAVQEGVSNFRIVLYSHDTMGFGHMRRNLLIARHLKNQFPNASILVIAGAKEATTFAVSAGVDCLTLPSFQKRPDGTYGSRNLEIPAAEIVNFRSQTICSAIQSYRPDLLIVDKMPAGAGGELLASLSWLRINSRCHCVLGLRDILDTAENVIRDWQQMHTAEIIREFFQSIWIYGDPIVFDAVREYQFPTDIAERVSFTGYLDPRIRLEQSAGSSDHNEPPFVLCTVGGGQDGKLLPVHFIEAIRSSGRPGTLLTGPYMPQSSRSYLKQVAETVPSLRVVEFVEEGDLLVRNSTHVVTMGGYNTLSAVLAYDKPALVIPRVQPRQEQSIRANRLAELGLVRTIHPCRLTAELIVEWIEDTSSCPPPEPGIRPDMNGLHRISELIQLVFPQIHHRNGVAL